MKMEIDSQWQSGIAVHARVRQFTKAAKLAGYQDFRTYAGLEAIPNESMAVDEWLDSIRGFKAAARIA